MTIAGLIQRFRRWRLARAGLSLDRSCTVGAAVHADRGGSAAAPGNLRAGPHCRIENGVQLMAWGGSIALGSEVFVGPFVVIYGHGGVSVGDHTLVSMHCRILSSNHAVPAVGTLIRSQPDLAKPTRIGADVWLGAGVSVLGGVTIGDGCVIGAGAVVTADLPAHSIAVGVPARVVGRRPDAPAAAAPGAGAAT